MKVGFFQFNPIFGKKDENLNRVLSAVRRVDTDLIVLPEFFTTGYQFASAAEVAEHAEAVPDGPTTDLLSNLAREKGLFIVAGLVEEAGKRFYNSAVLTGPEGFVGIYRKTHLYSEEKLYFTPGDTGFRVWNTAIGRIGVMICFDWFFPESMRSLALLGAEVVAHPSNLVLPYCPDAMPVRCLENRLFAVTANRIGTEKRKKGQVLTFIGQSEIVSPQGIIVTRASANDEVLAVADIDLMEARNKALNPFNDALGDRRPSRYGVLSEEP